MLNPSKLSPDVPRVPLHVYHVYQVLHPLPHPLDLTSDCPVGATEECEGSNWGYFGVLNPSRLSPGAPRVLVHMYHVYQVLHPLPLPLDLTSD